jgi:hypothetical protein
MVGSTRQVEKGYDVVVSLRNLFSSPTLQATAWVDRYSTSAPAEKDEPIATGHGLGRLAVDGETVWVTNAASRTLTRIDGRSGQVAGQADLRRTPSAIDCVNGDAWVICANGWLWRFTRSGVGEGVARLEDRARGLACDRESVWTLHATGRLLEIDQATGETRTESKISRGGRQLVHADDVLLALTANGSRVCDVESGTKLPARGVRATLHGGALWVACGRRFAPRWGALVRLDPATMTADSPLELPSAPRAIAADADHLWVACGRRGEKESSIVRVDPGSGEVTPWAESEWTIYDLTVAGEQLLAAAGVALAGPAAGMADGAAGAAGAPAHHGGHHGGGGGN